MRQALSRRLDEDYAETSTLGMAVDFWSGKATRRCKPWVLEYSAYHRCLTLRRP